MQAKNPVRTLEELPMPSIRPTMFSARVMDHGPVTAPEQIPSSPPLSNGSRSGKDGYEVTSTPPSKNTVSRANPLTPMQLSSPPGSPVTARKLTTVEKLKEEKRDLREKILTSSGVKGDAANSLLELMNSGSADEDEG
jgi:hypothetical protein